VFDVWVEKHCEGIWFVRYADDIICHCKTEQEAEVLHTILTARFADCGLTLHPEKTKIVYCKSWKHKADYARISFDFLGFTFQLRLTKLKDGVYLVCFTSNQPKSGEENPHGNQLVVVAALGARRSERDYSPQPKQTAGMDGILWEIRAWQIKPCPLPF
jgi:hypothetical protein